MDLSFTPPDPDAWLCLQAQPRRDQIAAGHLRQIEGVSVFAPRIRFHRRGKLGKRLQTEPLFPGYLFARFDFAPLYRLIRLTPGVSRLVEFGGRYATLDQRSIDALRELTGHGEIRDVTAPEPRSGDDVTLGAGPFAGSHGVVLDWKPAQERVRVLIELMGREVLTEVPLHDLTWQREVRSAVFGLAAT